MSTKKRKSTSLAGSEQPANRSGGDSQRAVVAQAWSGPLPPPMALEQFERIVPGSAQTIIGMAQQQQLHRINIETKEMNNQRIGLIAGIFIALFAIGGAMYYAMTVPIFAVALISLPVLGFVGILVGNKESVSPRSGKRFH